MWSEENNALVRTFTFKDFRQAFAFMIKVAAIAEDMQHHPRWTNEYNRVEIRLTTHDAGNVITDTDRRMAEQIDRLLA